MTFAASVPDPEAAPIPLVDLAWQTRVIANDVRAGFDRVLASSAFIGGPDVGAFERALADYTGVDHCIGVANGTDAIDFALRAAGIDAGDEVIIPANTFTATAAAVARVGARPVPVDCDPIFFLLDVEAARARLSAKTRAVVPVHLFGQIPGVERLGDLGDRCVIVEDAAQAQGATRNGRGIGSFGVATATSFYPGKNLGAFGDAGAVLTNDGELAARVRALGNHGETAKYHHDLVGWNSRLDTLQAVVLSAKLRHLDQWNELRRDAAGRYNSMLRDVSGVSLPEVAAGNTHAWHLYVVRVPGRNAVLARLHDAGVGAGVHYPVPIHLQPAFSWLGYGRGDFPVAEAAADEILSLPIFPGITIEQQERVVESLREAIRELHGA